MNRARFELFSDKALSSGEQLTVDLISVRHIESENEESVKQKLVNSFFSE